MKQLSCKDMGADDDFVAVGNSEDDVIKQMQDHVMSEHPDKWAEMEQMSDQEKNKMISDMKQKMQEA